MATVGLERRGDPSNKNGSGVHETFSAPYFGVRRPWFTLLSGKRLPRWVAAVGSIGCVLLLLLSSFPPWTVPTGNHHSSTDSSGGSVNATTQFPYVINASAFPSPDSISLGSANLTNPQLAVTALGFQPDLKGNASITSAFLPSTGTNVLLGGAADDNIPLYELVYVDRLSNGVAQLTFQSGQEDPQQAYSILSQSCGASCPHLPINWSAPVPIVSIGAGAVQGDAIASSGSLVAVAVANSGNSRVYYSENYGTSGSWLALTATGLIAGTSPHLAVDACAIFVTTQTGSATLATTMPTPCVMSPTIPGSSSSVPYAGGTPPSGGGNGPRWPSGPSGPVTGVSPSSGTTGTVVDVTGSGFQSGAIALFGGVASSVTSVTSSTSLTAVAPFQSTPGPVDVQVSQGGVTSPPNPPADLFNYVPTSSSAPTVVSVSPSTGSSGSTITVVGSGFQSGSTTVLFDGGAGSQVSVLSPNLLTVTTPSGAGAEDVQVQVGSVVSAVNWPNDVFTYAGTPSPTVIGILPNVGVYLSPVTVVGTDFAYPIQVLFNNIPSPNVLLLSTTELTALAPPGITGTSVDVQVQVGITQSPLNSPSDLFTYSTQSWPSVSSVVPTRGPVGTEVTVYGASFAWGASVQFGPYVSPSVTVVSSQVLTAMAPDGVGTVDITVTVGALTSNQSSSDQFTYTGTPQSASLPASVANTPLLLSTTGGQVEEAVLASVASNDSIQWWTSTNQFSSHSTAWLATYNASLGSAIFDRIGNTVLQVRGSSGQVTATAQGPYLFAAFTTRSQSVTGLDTLISTDGGAHWKVGSQLFAPRGSLADPIASPSPGGYVYLAARDNGQGIWEADEAVVSDTGQLLIPATPLVNSGGPNSTSVLGVGVAVDSVMRPLYLWSQANSTGVANLQYTGGFLSARQVVGYAQKALAQTQASDYRIFWSPAVYNFRQWLSTNLTAVTGDLQASQFSAAQTLTLGTLYPMMSVQRTSQVSVGPPAPNCSGSLGTWTNISTFANATEPYSAGTFMAVYLSWLLQAEGCLALDPPFWLGTPEHGGVLVLPTGNAGAVPLGTPGTASAYWGSITVTPIAANPNLVELNATPDIPGAKWTNNLSKCSGTINRWYPAEFVVTVTEGSTDYSFWSNWSIPSVYLTNVSQTSVGNWTEQVEAYFVTQTEQYNCDGNWTNTTTKPSLIGWLRMNGTYSTYLGYNPYPPTAVLKADASYPSQYDLVTNWTNSMIATVGVISVNGPNGFSAQSSNPAPSLDERFQFNGLVQSGTQYSWTASINSSAGSYQTAGPSINLGQVTQLSGPLYSNLPACYFTVTTNPIHIWWNPPGKPANNVTNVSATDATLTWYANQAGQGWVAYADTHGGSFGARAAVFELANHSAWEYVAELHGLDPWGLYNATVGVTAEVGGSTCVSYQNTVTWTFLTSGVAPMTESDYPYDSVTQQGGGALVEWTIPLPFIQRAAFLNGTLTYNNSTSVIHVPLPALWVVGVVFSGVTEGLTYGTNLTGLQLNGTYTVSLLLNFTFRGVAFTAVGEPLRFQYAKDTSGDGLTDWEKVQGWNVTAQLADGTWYSYGVQADTSLYATNGLVSDFVEKEFGLNPWFVDTGSGVWSGSSHMLDTWNLTFDLGTNSSNPKLPAGLPVQPWYELGKYDWTQSCQYFVLPGQTCHKAVLASGISNISDNSNWSARVLWSRAALNKFVNLSGVKLESLLGDSLRGIVGTSNGERTLTIWGKLSWGANPLATSTPLNGIPDGARVNPLYDEQLVIGSLSATLGGTGHSCPKAPSGGAYGWAVQFYLNWSKTTGPHELPAGGNYSVAALDSSSDGTTNCGSISNYQVAIPVNGTSQNQSLQVRILLNQSSSPGSTVLKPQAFSGSATEISISYDALSGKLTSFPSSGSYSGTNGTLSFTLSMAPSGVKANTLLWLPTDNGTLNNLPWGLKRYTGEQAFDLLTVDQTNGYALTSDSIPYAQNGSHQYSLTLNPGLNNLLIPRGQFMYSVLGQAVLLGQNTSWTNASARPPLLGSDENGSIGFGSSNPLKNLGCYWQNRAISSGSGAICNSEGGTGDGAEQGIVVVASTASSGINIGGVPADSAMETQSQAGAALQTVLTLNVSTTTELDLLLAALLDNTTGGVNGTFLQVTYQVPSLGLNPVVTRELVNATLTSSGFFGVPWGRVPPPPAPPPCNSVWCWGSNLVSGAVSIGLHFYSFVWTLSTAVAIFIDDHLPTWLKNLGATIAARTVSALDGIGAALANALSQLLQAILYYATSLIDAAFAPVLNLASTTASNENATITNYAHSGYGYGPLSPLSAATVARDITINMTSLFMLVLVLAVVVEVVYGVFQVVTGGASLLVSGIVIGIFISAGVAIASYFFDKAITSFQQQLVWDADGFENCSSLNIPGFSCSPGNGGQQVIQPLWGVLAIFASAPEAGFIVSSLDFAFASVALGTVEAAAAVSFALACVGLAITWWVYVHPSYSGAALALSFVADAGSFILDYASLAKAKAGTALSPSKQAAIVLDGVSFAMDGASLTGDGAKWYCAHSKC